MAEGDAPCTSINWNRTNRVIFNITANTSNPATNLNVSFSTKTNAVDANPNSTWMSFNYPVIPNGTWTITINQNTNFTITATEVTATHIPPAASAPVVTQ